MLTKQKIHPAEGTSEWWDAVARSHLRCAEPNSRLAVPEMRRTDHIALAAKALANAILMRAQGN